ncbi:MAG: addiction module toxin, HicA family [Candidatus Latescibacteria bacterium]|jgi:predicted RNA binding protein YcfA (HicA-like mRNA interferase family)|nr:addiction module toxin, HicA family [Candidatus Latescibacterota bacterium]
MPKLKRISGKETIRILEKHGFIQIRQRGSHVLLKKQTAHESVGCVVPLHKELAVGTLYGIIKQAKLSVEEFTEK